MFSANLNAGASHPFNLSLNRLLPAAASPKLSDEMFCSLSLSWVWEVLVQQ